MLPSNCSTKRRSRETDGPKVSLMRERRDATLQRFAETELITIAISILVVSLVARF